MRKSKLNIKYYGDPVLNKVSTKIDIITNQIRNLASEMIEVMDIYDGVGLAAPQIGVNWNMIVINLPVEYLNNSNSPGEALLMPQMPVSLINPEITSFSKKMAVLDEGCLSVPQVYAPVTRPVAITIKAQMLSGETINIECGGFLAKVLQHEVDHLKGVLFIERLEPKDLKKISKKLNKLKQV